MYHFYITYSIDESSDLMLLLDNNDVAYQLPGQKGIDIPTVLYVSAAALTIVDILKKWLSKRKADGLKVITRSGKQYNLRTTPTETVIKAIKTDSFVVGEAAEQSLPREKVGMRKTRRRRSRGKQT